MNPDILTGFGLSILLELSRTSPDMDYFLPIYLSSIVVAGILVNYCHPPPFVILCNATFSLILTISVVLNLFAQLLPNGKELSLIPVFVLLCIPRMRPSGNALIVQMVLSLIMVVVFLFSPSKREGSEGNTLSLALSVGIGSMLNFNHKVGFWGVIVKGLIILLLGGRLFQFFHQSNDSPKHIFFVYGVLLLFSMMNLSAVWFDMLKEVVKANWRLVVRIQHILIAFIVGAAWAFPLQLHSLRVMLMVMLFILQFFK
jgi:hypothetical protein